MSGVVPVSLSRWVRHLSLAVAVWFSMKHTYNNTRSHKYAGDPYLYIIHLVVCFMYLYFPSIWFCCCWCGSLSQLPITYVLRISRTLPLVSTCAWSSLMSLYITPLYRIMSSKDLMNYLSTFTTYPNTFLKSKFGL